MRYLKSLSSLLVLLLLMGPAAGQETGHYLPGLVNNAGQGALPPFPGIYYSQFTMNYSSSILKDRNGRTTGNSNTRFGPINLDTDISVNLMMPVLTGMTDVEILGGRYGASLFLPYSNANVGVNLDLFGRFQREANQSNYGLADIGIAPIQLGWQGENWSALANYVVWLPTGRYSNGSPDNLGLGYVSHNFQLGGAVNLDEAKTWRLSGLGTFEVNGRKDDVDIRPGNSFNLEYGLSKKVTPTFEVGLTGFSHWQTSADSGSAIPRRLFPLVNDEVHALGAELSWTIPEANNLSISLRHLREFGAVDRPQGHMTMVNLSLPIKMWLPQAPAAAPPESEEPRPAQQPEAEPRPSQPAEPPAREPSEPETTEPEPSWFRDDLL